jgi:putative transposase
LRIEYPGAVYHIINRGNEREEIFVDDEDRLKLLDMLSDYHERFGILVHCYALLDNHYHIVIETLQGNLLGTR